MAMRVAPSRGQAVRLAVRVRATCRSVPRYISPMMPSITTMALSTSIPMATMKAPREMRCRVPPVASSTGKVARTVRASAAPMMSPLLRPMAAISTSTTMPTEAARLPMNPPMASPTLSGWKNTFSKRIPAGRAFRISCIRASTRLPTWMMFSPLSIDTAMAMAS